MRWLLFCWSTATLTCRRESFQAQAQSVVVDPFANVSTPLRESMRNAHQGVTINIQVLEWMQDYITEKIANYEALTGVKINTIPTSQATWFDDIQEDINGAGFIDLYAIFGNWIPTFVEENGLLDVTEEVGEAVGLDWFDIMPGVRQGVASYRERVWTVPLDGDVIVMLYRSDLVEGRGLNPPRTWDDVLDIIEYYSQPENADINGDGVADFANCFSTAENDIAGTMFWSIASSFLQTKGTAQGTFFDPESFDPISKWKKEEFLHVLEVYNKLVQSSPFRDLGQLGWQGNLAEFEAGRCVLWYNYPGPTRILVSNQEANNMTGVLNYAALPGMACEGDDAVIECPFVSNGGANHAPFLASGGMSYVVSARSSEKKQKAALDFSFYISDPAVSFWDVANPGSFLDPLRRRHTASLSNPTSLASQAFLQYGWEERQLPQIQTVTEFNFLHENYVLDLRILGANNYQEEGTVPHLVKMWNGEQTAEETADVITASWSAITEKFGLNEQRAMYRETLGLAPYTEPSNASARLEIIIPVVVVISLLILGLVALVAKQHHTIKYKTRDINNAPRDGLVALVFTDIEGSTALWDASKSTMSAALEIHHSVIRKCIDRHHAYEVKTIGDAFMVACPSADVAVYLANDIQIDLLAAEWPVELANMPSACVEFMPTHSRETQPKPMFRGLRVRIGIHIGEHSDSAEEGGQVQVKYDNVTKGYDYYGPATNAAARIEALGFGGQTLISSDIFENLSKQVRDECLFSQVGALELKGVSHEVFIHQCLPKQLKGRRFRGVFRRRDSEGGSIIPDDDESMHLLDDSIHDEDRTVDVMTLNPVQLQSTVVRLRTKMSALEKMLQGREYSNVGMSGASTGRPQDALAFLGNSTHTNASEITTGDDSNHGEVKKDD